MTKHEFVQSNECEGKIMLLNTAKYVGVWHDEKAVKEWQLAHDTKVREFHARKEMERLAKKDSTREMFETLHSTYRHLSSREKPVFLATVIRKVMYGS